MCDGVGMTGGSPDVLAQWVGAQAATVIEKPMPAAHDRRRFDAPASHDPAHRWHARSDDPVRRELVRLITFVWRGRAGSQPVIYAVRSWLQ